MAFINPSIRDLLRMRVAGAVVAWNWALSLILPSHVIRRRSKASQIISHLEFFILLLRWFLRLALHCFLLYSWFLNRYCRGSWRQTACFGIILQTASPFRSLVLNQPYQSLERVCENIIIWVMHAWNLLTEYSRLWWWIRWHSGYIFLMSPASTLIRQSRLWLLPMQHWLRSKCYRIAKRLYYRHSILIWLLSKWCRMFMILMIALRLSADNRSRIHFFFGLHIAILNASSLLNRRTRR